MRRNTITNLLVAFSVLALAEPAIGQALAPRDQAKVLGFEAPAGTELSDFWDLKPQGAAIRDDSIAYSGNAAARMERTEGADGDFSSIGFRIPLSDAEGLIKLKAAIKVDAQSGMTSLWARQDGATGRLAYVNQRENSLTSAQDWGVQELEMELVPNATSLSVGVFFAGSGTVFVDAFELSLNDEVVEIDFVKSKQSRQNVSDFEFASGSGVDISSLTPNQAENLAVFIKVWGFLKYHHPAITAGKADWDAAFLHALPVVLSAPNAVARNEWLNDWIEDLGDVTPCAPCVPIASDAALRPATAWIEDKRLGAAISKKLIDINRNQTTDRSQHYVKRGSVGQAEFQNEPTYSALGQTDSGFRILAVARYWNMIEYWFPYRDIIDTDWDLSLDRALIDVVESKSEQDYQLAMMRLISAVQDTHAKLHSHLSLLPPSGECDLPIHVRFIASAPTIAAVEQNRKFFTPGFKAGDVILSIDATPIEALIAEMRPLYAASNESAQNRDMAVNLTRGACGRTRIEIERAGQQKLIFAHRTEGMKKHVFSLPHDRPGDTAQMLDHNIGYIKMSSVTREDVPSYVETVREADGLIIDIRNYPGDFMPYVLGRWFADAPTQFAKLSVPNFDRPGEFVWIDGPPIPPIAADQRLDLPIAILVDEVTQSSAEYTAMAFRALPKSIVVGSQTAGADGNIARIVLPGNLHTIISGIGVFYPDGTPTQKIGITPDIDVAPTRNGIIEGRDEVLERALEYLKEQTLDDGSTEVD